MRNLEEIIKDLERENEEGKDLQEKREEAIKQMRRAGLKADSLLLIALNPEHVNALEEEKEFYRFQPGINEDIKNTIILNEILYKYFWNEPEEAEGPSVEDLEEELNKHAINIILWPGTLAKLEEVRKIREDLEGETLTDEALINMYLITSLEEEIENIKNHE